MLRGDDALRCLDAGAEAVYVSNHGGRQLDRAVDTATALREVVAAVGDRAEVYVDGGIRPAPTCWPRSPSARGGCSWADRLSGRWGPRAVLEWPACWASCAAS